MANIVALVSEMDIPQCIALRIIAVTIIALVYILVHSPADISFHVRNLLSFEVKHFTESIGWKQRTHKAIRLNNQLVAFFNTAKRFKSLI